MRVHKGLGHGEEPPTALARIVKLSAQAGFSVIDQSASASATIANTTISVAVTKRP